MGTNLSAVDLSISAYQKNRCQSWKLMDQFWRWHEDDRAVMLHLFGLHDFRFGGLYLKLFLRQTCAFIHIRKECAATISVLNANLWLRTNFVRAVWSAQMWKYFSTCFIILSLTGKTGSPYEWHTKKHIVPDFRCRLFQSFQHLKHHRFRYSHTTSLAANVFTTLL